MIHQRPAARTQRRSTALPRLPTQLPCGGAREDLQPCGACELSRTVAPCCVGRSPARPCTRGVCQQHRRCTASVPIVQAPRARRTRGCPQAGVVRLARARCSECLPANVQVFERGALACVRPLAARKPTVNHPFFPGSSDSYPPLTAEAAAEAAAGCTTTTIAIVTSISRFLSSSCPYQAFC